MGLKFTGNVPKIYTCETLEVCVMHGAFLFHNTENLSSLTALESSYITCEASWCTTDGFTSTEVAFSFKKKEVHAA